VKTLPTGDRLQRIQNFANLLQGYYNAVIAEVITSQDQASNIAAEAKRLDLKDAALLPGWRVTHLPLVEAGRVDPLVPGGAPAQPSAPKWLVSGPMHSSALVPWAVSPGFSGNRDAALRFLAETWLSDFKQRLEAAQVAAMPEKK